MGLHFPSKSARTMAEIEHAIKQGERIGPQVLVLNNEYLLAREEFEHLLELRRVKAASQVGIAARSLPNSDFLVARERINKFQRFLVLLAPHVPLRKRAFNRVAQ